MTIKLGTLTRSFSVDRSAINQDARTVELAFSSEAPVDRWFGSEILDHSPQSVRLGRLSDGGPLLVDHDPTDHVGVIESVSIDQDRMGRAVVRFGRSARADEIYQDVVDSIRRNISVSYRVHKMVLTQAETKTSAAIYRITDWEPLEVSFVSIPADASVGVGRSMSDEYDIPVEMPAALSDAARTQSSLPTQESAGSGPAVTTAITVQERSMPDVINEAATRARQDTSNAVGEIVAMGDQFKRFGGDKIANEFLRSGVELNVEHFRKHLLDKIDTAAHTADAVTEIGMSGREASQFSMVRLLNALANPGDRKAREAAAFEFECSEAVSNKLGRSAQGAFVPMDVQKRDLTVGTAGAGGYTVATDLMADNFIELLRNRMMTMRMGARMLTGLIGNVAIPRQSGGATAYWVTEGNAPTESAQAFEQLALAPKTVGAFTDISRKLLLQSSIDVESFVRTDLATTLALEIDRAAINGSGSGAEPLGIVQNSNITSIAGGTNGAAPTWANIVALWSAVANANADFGTTGFLTNSKVIGKLMTTEKATNTAQFVCGDFPGADGMTSIGGARSGVSNQVPGNLTKGTANAICSAIIFGNWAELIYGQWGALDLLVDPYTASTTGTVRIVALQDIDIALRHLASFSVMKDALTS